MTEEWGTRIGLLSMRLGVATVFMAWTIDKMVNYAHNAGMIGHYYGLQISQPVLLAVGIVELVIVLAFIAGIYKTLTYGFILLAHTGTTIASFHRLLPPYEIHQLLYFGSIPMLGACIGLFLMRDKDTLLTFKGFN